MKRILFVSVIVLAFAAAYVSGPYSNAAVVIVQDDSVKDKPITVADWYGVPYDQLQDRLKGLYIPSARDITVMAKMGDGEARGVKSDTEVAAVFWVVCNRYDYGAGKTLTRVVTAKSQFDGYKTGEYGNGRMTWLAKDVVTRWLNEKLGFTDVGRVLPVQYRWFEGGGTHNYFRDAYRKTKTVTPHRWDWSLPSPYET